MRAEEDAIKRDQHQHGRQSDGRAPAQPSRNEYQEGKRSRGRRRLSGWEGTVASAFGGKLPYWRKVRIPAEFEQVARADATDQEFQDLDNKPRAGGKAQKNEQRLVRFAECVSFRQNDVQAYEQQHCAYDILRAPKAEFPQTLQKGLLRQNECRPLREPARYRQIDCREDHEDKADQDY